MVLSESNECTIAATLWNMDRQSVSAEVLTMQSLADAEIERHGWSALREIAGPATHIPTALRALLSATTKEEANAAYWRLENHVVVQGNLFEAAEFVVPVILAALADDPANPSRNLLLELLFQIVHGEPHESEIQRGNTELGNRCRARAREGLWLLYRHLRTETGDGALDVLEVIELDRTRLDLIVAERQ